MTLRLHHLPTPCPRSASATASAPATAPAIAPAIAHCGYLSWERLRRYLEFIFGIRSGESHIGRVPRPPTPPLAPPHAPRPRRGAHIIQSAMMKIYEGYGCCLFGWVVTTPATPPSTGAGRCPTDDGDGVAPVRSLLSAVRCPLSAARCPADESRGADGAASRKGRDWVYDGRLREV